MSEVVNLQRLCRSCESILVRASHSDTGEMERRDAVRLGVFVERLRMMVADVGARREALGVEEEKLLSVARKIVLFDRQLAKNDRTLEYMDEIGNDLGHGKSRPNVPHENPSPAFTGTVEEEGALLPTARAVDDTKPTELNSNPCDSLFAGSKAFAKLMAAGSEGNAGGRGNIFGKKAMIEQVAVSRREKAALEDELSGMVSKLKQSVLKTNEKIQFDKSKLESVEKEFEKNLNYLSKISDKLDFSLNSTSINCKMCTAGVGLVLMMWVAAYLIMRIFPKVKPPPLSA